MTVWAIADLHLAKSIPSKSMEVFGPQWEKYMDRMEHHWRALIAPDDLVLLPGDISWAIRLEEARDDLEWIHALPGTKVMIRGNHDYWWSSGKKLRQHLPPSIHYIHNTAFHWHDVAIAGTRLWDTPEYQFGAYVHFQPRNETAIAARDNVTDDEAVFRRELERLRMSLQQMRPDAKVKLAMTHYPPIGADLVPSQASQLLEQFGVQECLFGHLHNLDMTRAMFGTERGVKYTLVAADYLQFVPYKITL